MHRRECHVIFSILIYINVTRAGLMKSSKYFARREAKFKNEYILEEIVTTSRSVCLRKCDTTSDCISASWNSNEKTCLLSVVDQIHDSWDSTLPPELITSTRWETFSRIIYPVFHVFSPAGRYTMAFLEANEACKKRGGTLASPSDLLTARRLGFGNCNCGWLTDQTKGFVLQELDPSCLGWFETGIYNCEWLSTANAWCTFV